MLKKAGWMTVCVMMFLNTMVCGALPTDAAQALLDVPADLPNTFAVNVPFAGRHLTLRMQKNAVFGQHTRFLVDDGTGSLVQTDRGIDRSYLGTVDECPDYTVSAVLTQDGLIAGILRPGREPITIEPVQGSRLHRISVNPTGDYKECKADAPTLPGMQTDCVAASTGPVMTVPCVLAAVTETGKTSTATLRPTRVMDVLEFEIGVEIGSRAFLASTYENSLEKARASAQSLVDNLDARYLRAAGIKHRLGTVIIRTKAETDPLREKVTATGTRGNSSLAAFRDYWNSHPDEVGKTHDLAVYHVKSAPSGLSYMNSVGSGNRYATCGGNGATSWANGTLVHEFGHSWGLKHNNSSGMFYESKPRNVAGSHAAGGEDTHISVMHGGGSHNIGRLATDEANKVYQTRQNKRKYGDLVSNPGPIAPFGHRDEAFVLNGKPVTIDVIANDYDCNNDVLDVQVLDTVSRKGGTVQLSAGTGPGRRNQVVYTPPAGFVGRDFFHYTVFDTTGLKDWGAVYVTCEGDRVVDTTLKEYNYDLGPLDSPLQAKWAVISPETTGDICWTGDPVKAVDRGQGNANDINRDFVYGSGKATLNHKIANGTWEITINMGDRTGAHDLMGVLAEGRLLCPAVHSAAGEFPYAKGRVTVTDGQLNLEFFDKGGKDPNWTVTRLSLTRVEQTPEKVSEITQ